MVDRTPEERAIIEGVAETHGEDWAAEHEALILAQARLVGEL